MSAFADAETASQTVARINEATLRSTGEFILPAAESSSRPDQALVNLERWLLATASPTTFYDSMTAVPELGLLLIELFGASYQIADVLVQNPEFAATILDPALLQERPVVETLNHQARSMLAESGSYSHALDRLRFLKQGWHVRIAAADLAGAWPEEDVWKGLSVVADALISNAASVVWEDVCRQRGYSGQNPVSIVAMGKLGGQELNFSSDVDLIFVLDDAADEATEKAAVRYCEALTRALADKMGRGSLYRVDLRLRPYGSRGPLAPKMASVESYYLRYAESWEHLALIRSRVVVGSSEVRERWAGTRRETCFKPQRGEWVVQELLRMRARIEENRSEGDLKRGIGGIRDVEFLTQILQLLYGFSRRSVDVLSTCGALRALGEQSVLAQRAVEDLIAAYTFMRQVEHRIQLLGDQQTHSVPTDIAARTELSKRAGFATLDGFDTTLAMHRAHARDWYEAILSPSELPVSPAREQVLSQASDLSSSLSPWIDGLPESGSFYESLAENESSLQRALRVVERAPALVPQLRQFVSVTEQVMTGEVLEPMERPLRAAYRSDEVEAFAQAIRIARLRSGVRWSLDTGLDYGEEIATMCDFALATVLEDIKAPFQVVALGSYGAREMTLYSDLDVVFYTPKDGDAEQVERAAQRVLSSIQALRRAGAPIDLDLRLRPEGKKGRLVVTEELLTKYESSKMEPWERLALGRSRCSGGVPEPILKAAFGRPLDEGTLRALLSMKHRIETERVPVQHRKRHLKLGPGGQDDVLWTVQLLWWREYAELQSEVTSVRDRLDVLTQAGHVSDVEREQLQDAMNLLRKLRLQLALLGYNDEVLPENPDKLERLGAALGIGGANDVLSRYEANKTSVRGLFEATVERLGG